VITIRIRDRDPGVLRIAVNRSRKMKDGLTVRVLSEQKQQSHREKPALDCVVFAHTYPFDRLQLVEKASDVRHRLATQAGNLP
jgi:hypothetical protein